MSFVNYHLKICFSGVTVPGVANLLPGDRKVIVLSWTTILHCSPFVKHFVVDKEQNSLLSIFYLRRPTFNPVIEGSLYHHPFLFEPVLAVLLDQVHAAKKKKQTCFFPKVMSSVKVALSYVKRIFPKKQNDHFLIINS